MFRVITPAILTSLLIALLFTACGSTARYKASEFGPKVEGNMESALANIDSMMKDMQGTMAKAGKKQQQNITLGEKLFSDAKLGGGKKGQSCSSCHPSGGTTGGTVKVPMRSYQLPVPSLIGAAAHFPKYKIPNNSVITLEQMDNNCIRMFMGGKRLELNSPESLALAAYVSSLSNGVAVDVGK